MIAELKSCLWRWFEAQMANSMSTGVIPGKELTFNNRAGDSIGSPNPPRIGIGNPNNTPGG